MKVDGELPSADRTAHLLLALREDEEGFATVANLAFSGADPARAQAAAGGDAAGARRRRRDRLTSTGCRNTAAVIQPAGHTERAPRSRSCCT